MFLSKFKNGYYYVYYTKKDGKRSRISTKSKTKSGAFKFLTNFNQELKKREAEKTIPILMKKFFFDFNVYSELLHSHKTVLSQKTTCNELLKFFGDIQIKELTKEKILDFILYRLRKVSAYSVKRDIQNLSNAFYWGIQKKYLENNQCDGIKKPKLPEKQPKYFSIEEYKILINSIENSDIKDIVQFAVNTGLREMELLRLRWEQINMEKKLLYINNLAYLSKNGKIRTMPLNDKAMAILIHRLSNAKSDYIFTYEGKMIQQSLISHKFKSYVRNSGVNPALNFHSLRHTFASWLVQKGVTIYDVSKLLGHSTINSTEIYAHLRVDELRSAVEKLN